MPLLSAYMGLVTGLLLTGMGVYLYMRPIEGGWPGWVSQGLPAFMIAYGLFRLGFSAYQLLRKRPPRSEGHAILLVFALLLGLGCSSDPEVNLRLRMDYAGECASCPLQRMDSILRVFFPTAIAAVSYDSVHHQVVIDMDSQRVSLDTLRTVLLAYGYEIEEEIPLDPILSPCCIHLAEAAGTSSAIALAAPQDQAEEMTALERELEADLLPESAPINLEGELNLEDNIESLEDLSLDEGLDAGDISLDELDLEEDLGLDDIEGSSSKSKPKKSGSPPK